MDDTIYIIYIYMCVCVCVCVCVCLDILTYIIYQIIGQSSVVVWSSLLYCIVVQSIFLSLSLSLSLSLYTIYRNVNYWYIEYVSLSLSLSLSIYIYIHGERSVLYCIYVLSYYIFSWCKHVSCTHIMSRASLYILYKS